MSKSRKRSAKPTEKPFDRRATTEFYADFVRTMRGTRFDPSEFAREVMVRNIVATSAIEGITLDPDEVRRAIERREAGEKAAQEQSPQDETSG